MAIQQGLTNNFKQDMLQAGQNLLTDTLKMALYTGTATVGATTTAYTSANEVTGAGYTAGGKQVTGATLATDVTTGVVYVNFSNVSWAGASFTARGALIYNTSKSNKSVLVLDFGADKIFSSTSNTVTMPANTASTALIRLP
jgi:hypothetical protein